MKTIQLSFLSLLFLGLSCSSLFSQDNKKVLQEINKGVQDIKNEIKKTKKTKSIKKKVIRGFNLQTENDFVAGLFSINNGDKDYTGGFKFEFYTDYLNFGFLGFLKNKNEKNRRFYYNFNSVYLAGMGYTPRRDAFAETEPVTDQRPYASVLSLGKRRVAIFKKINFAVETDFRIGKIGLEQPGQFQNFLHEYVTNSQIVKGWENQIGNGGRWIYNFRIRANIDPIRFYKSFYGKEGEDGKSKKTCKFKDISFYLTPYYSWGNLFKTRGIGISLTNRSIFSKGLMTSMGSGAFDLNDSSGGMNYGKFYDKRREKGKRFNWENFRSHFGWDLYYNYQYVQHNTILEGLPFYDNSIYTIDDKDMIRSVHDFGAKVLFNYFPEKERAVSRHSTLYIELIYRSKEFSYHESHVYGNIGITVLFLEKGHLFQ